jgi:hypothetical protein
MCFKPSYIFIYICALPFITSISLSQGAENSIEQSIEDTSILLPKNVPTEPSFIEKLDNEGAFVAVITIGNCGWQYKLFGGRNKRQSTDYVVADTGVFGGFSSIGIIKFLSSNELLVSTLLLLIH